MSGIVGVAHYGPKPIDSIWLEKAAGYLAFRGPDNQAIWFTPQVGLGHALLQTTYDTEHVPQPYSLDGEVWVTADVRMDGRATLIRRLQQHGRGIDSQTADVALILHAYAVWGQQCLQYMIGDFAFAIWDNRRQRLFCAVDQFGIVPFYYACLETGIAFSNTLNALRYHPEVSDQLNGEAVADYLLLRQYRDPEVTIFSDIHRVPSHHCLIFEQGQVQIQSYYELPRFDSYLTLDKQSGIKQFLHLFDEAVADRLRTTQIASQVSGGMDSTSVTATAYRTLARQNHSFDFDAFTFTFPDIDDEDGVHAVDVVEHLRLQHHHIIDCDRTSWHFDLDAQDFCLPEPSLIREDEIRFLMLRPIAKKGRVLLSGEGGDGLLPFASQYWQGLIQARNWRVFAKESLKYYRYHQQRPLSIRKMWHFYRQKSHRETIPALPTWINPSFAQNHKLQAILLQHHRDLNGVNSQEHLLWAGLWRRLFTWHDPGFTGVATKVRHPFFDLRLVHFMLQLPPHIWTHNKALLRWAMADRLPRTVLHRPKQGRIGHPIQKTIAEGGIPAWCLKVLHSSAIGEYVDLTRLINIITRPNEFMPHDYRYIMRPLSFAYWLYKQQSTSFNMGSSHLLVPKPAFHKWQEENVVIDTHIR